jgi:PAS domain S-box-containing protein
MKGKKLVPLASLLIVVAATVLRLGPLSALGTRAPYLTFYPAVILAALYGGWWGGLLATIFSAFAADYFCIELAGHFRIQNPVDWLRTGVFSFSGVLISFITERMHKAQAKAAAAEAEVRLASTANRLAAIVESSDDAIIGKDLNSIITTWNKGAEVIFGYTVGEMAGTSIQRLIPADRHNEEIHLLEQIKQGDRLEHIETLRQTKDGRLINVSVTASPIKDASGKIIGVSSVMRDITERVRAREKIQQLNSELEKRVIERTAQLESANKELEAFSYSVSHDLRAPLRAVDGFSQAVLEDYGPQLPDGCREDLQIIRHGAQKMGELIDDLLTFSRLSRLPLTKSAVDTGNLVRSALEELASQREGRHIEIRIADLPPCQADPALVKQVWINLLSNALKYTGKRDNAFVEIGCSRNNGHTVFFVRDNGTGFDMKYANKLFGVFQRLHRAEDYDGTGVGLAIVQRVVHRHGGRVWAESALDHGATFFFTLEGENKS